MTDTVNVAVLSLNGMNRSFAEAFHANPRARIVAVTEDDPPPATARTTPEETQQGNRDGRGRVRRALRREPRRRARPGRRRRRHDNQPLRPPGGSGREGRLGGQAHLHRQADYEHPGRRGQDRRQRRQARREADGRPQLPVRAVHPGGAGGPAIRQGRPALGDTQRLDRRRGQSGRRHRRAHEPRHVPHRRPALPRARRTPRASTASPAPTSSTTPRRTTSRTWASSP